MKNNKTLNYDKLSEEFDKIFAGVSDSEIKKWLKKDKKRLNR